MKARDVILAVAQIIDPYTKDGTKLTSSNICTAGYDGDRFTKERLLDIYNSARYSLFGGLYTVLPISELNKYVYGGMIDSNVTSSTYSLANDRCTIEKPSGYLRLLDLSFRNQDRAVVGATGATPIVITTVAHGYLTGDTVKISGLVGVTAANNTEANPFWVITKTSSTQFSLNGSAGTGSWDNGGTVIPVNTTPITVLPPEYISLVRYGTNPYYTQTTSNIFAFEEGANYVSYGNFIPEKLCKLRYYGITDLILADITGGTVTDIFVDDLKPLLVDIAVMIANEQGNIDTVSLVKNLLQMKGK